MNKKKNLTTEETFALAVQNHQKNNLKFAENLYKEILKTNPNHFAPIYLLVTLLIQKKDFNRSIQLLKKAVQIQPNHASAHNNLGIALISNDVKNYQVANDCFNKAIKIDPNFAEAFYNLGNMCKDENYEEAKNLYRKALKIKPNYTNAYINLGVVSEYCNEFDEAINCFQKAANLKPNDPKIYSLIGSVLEKSGKNIAAIENYQKALEKRTNIKFEGEKRLHPAIKYFYLELTNKCNFHCEFCPSDLQSRSHGFMDISLAKKIFDEIAQKKLVDQVNLHLMGEPTLHPKLNDILIYAKKKNVKIGLTTNGSTLVAKKIPELLESISGEITASLMTPTKETYKIRGDVKLNWDRYIDNFRLLVQEHLKRISEGKKNEYNIQIRIMVSGGDSRKGTVKVVETPQDIEKNWNIWTTLVKDTEKQLGLKPFNHQKIDSNTVLSLVNKKGEASYGVQKDLKINFWRAFTFANSRVSDDYELKYQKTAQYCPRPFTDLGILWNGDVNPCCLDHDGTLKIGDVRNHSIEAVLHNAAAKKIRGSMYSLEALHPTCQKCQARPVAK